MTPDLESLVLSHERMARSIAYNLWRTAPQSLHLDDLVSLAFEGLVMAAARWPAYCQEHGFDPSRTEYFTSYVQRRIKGSIIDAGRATDHVTRATRAKSRLIRDEINKTGEQLSDQELSDRTGLSVADVRYTNASIINKPVSLDEPAQFDVAVPSDVEDAVVLRHSLHAIGTAFDDMPQANQVILSLHYLLGIEVRAIADILGITESRASHIHAQSVLKVRQALISDLVPG